MQYRRLGDVSAEGRVANDKMNSFIQRLLNAENFEKVNEISVITDKPGIPAARLALAWVLRQPDVAGALIGTSWPEQVEKNVKASGYTIPCDVPDTIGKVLLA